MSQKPSLFASSLHRFAFGDPFAEKPTEARTIVEWSRREAEEINSKLPDSLKKLLNLDAEDKEWKDVDKIEDLKECKDCGDQKGECGKKCAECDKHDSCDTRKGMLSKKEDTDGSGRKLKPYVNPFSKEGQGASDKAHKKSHAKWVSKSKK